MAQRAGDQGTVDVVERILTEERAAAKKFAASFEDAVSAAMAEQGVA